MSYFQFVGQNNHLRFLDWILAESSVGQFSPLAVNISRRKKKKSYHLNNFIPLKHILLPEQSVDTIHFMSQSLLKTIKYNLIDYRMSKSLNLVLKAIYYLSPHYLSIPFLYQLPKHPIFCLHLPLGIFPALPI